VDNAEDGLVRDEFGHRGPTFIVVTCLKCLCKLYVIGAASAVLNVCPACKAEANFRITYERS
jgi:hypothetical protein